MPTIQRHNLPSALLHHLLDRIREREIGTHQLGELADWLDTRPEVPEQRWDKKFSQMTVCGEGAWIRTFLRADQVPLGDEVR